MDAENIKPALEAQSINRSASDTLIAYIDHHKTDLVTYHTLTSQIALLRADLRLEKSELRTEFAEHRLDINRLVLGSSGALGALMIVLRFMPA